MNKKHTKNPFVFLDNLEIKTKKRKLTVEAGTEIECENEIFTTTISQIHEVDKEQFIKLYINQINIFFDLTITANKLFMTVMYLLSKEIGKDTIYLNYQIAKEISEELNIPLSSAVYYRAMKELQTKKIIAESDKKYIYFINPAILFNGDRAKFVREIKIKEEEKTQEELRNKRRFKVAKNDKEFQDFIEDQILKDQEEYTREIQEELNWKKAN